jgi:hypothetical protein
MTGPTSTRRSIRTAGIRAASRGRPGVGLGAGLGVGLRVVMGVALLAVGCADEQAPAPGSLDQVATPEPVESVENNAGSSDVTIEDQLVQEGQHVDPRLDGWDTEELQGAAGSRLKELAGFLAVDGPLDAEPLADWVTDDFWCSPLVPADADWTQRYDGLRVHVDQVDSTRRAGAAGLALSLTELRDAFGDAGHPHVKYKIVSVDPGTEDVYGTTVLVQIWADTGPGDLAQRNCVWQVGWTWPDHEAPPRLASLELTSSNGARADRSLFSDCTEAVIGSTETWAEQFLRSTDDWCARIDAAANMNQYAHNGITVGDFDDDGLEDVYVLQNGGLPNRLFRQLPDGTAEEVSEALGLDWLEEHRAALLVDLDNDGTRELVISSRRSVLVLRRGTSGRYSIARKLPTPDGYSLAAADYNEDGLLDLYVCGYQTPTTILPTPYHDALNGAPNALYKNLGQLWFENHTHSTGLAVDNSRFSFAATWIDYDDDGDQDLYVANDFGRNNLYRNDDGHFLDVAGEAGVEDMAAGMGISWADYDGDGDLDLYVSNMFSSAGNRIAYQRRFRSDSTQDTRSALQRHARGNSLFANQGDGTFLDVTESSGTAMGRWAWGAQFVDFDNDGREDLFIPNGFMTNERTNDL